jgi:Flp pilus assembly protein TadG
MISQLVARYALRCSRLGRDARGVTAIEFALIAPIFIAFILAIIDISFYFFSVVQLNAALQTATREVRTGTITGNTGAAKTAFKNVLCQQITNTTVAFIRNCAVNVQVDIRPFSSFGASVFVNPDTDGDGTISDAEAVFDTGVGSQIILARAFYKYNSFFPILANLMAATTPDGKYIIVTSAFRNEPF